MAIIINFVRCDTETVREQVKQVRNGEAMDSLVEAAV